MIRKFFLYTILLITAIFLPFLSLAQSGATDPTLPPSDGGAVTSEPTSSTTPTDPLSTPPTTPVSTTPASTSSGIATPKPSPVSTPAVVPIPIAISAPPAESITDSTPFEPVSENYLGLLLGVLGVGLGTFIFFKLSSKKKKQNEKEDSKCLSFKKLMEEKLNELTDLKGQLTSLAKREASEQVKNVIKDTKARELATFVENGHKEYERLKELYEKCITDLKNNKIIIFDMDGVLFNSTLVARENMKNQFPDLTDEMQKEILAGNFHEEVSKLTIPRKKETEEEKNARKLQYSKDKSTSSMYEGARELLLDLHKDGYVLAMNTSALDRNCLPLLDNSNTKDLFDFLATAELSKSKTKKFEVIQERYGVDKNKMLFITDTLGDIREADIAGVPTVAVTWGVHDESYFNREPHKNLIGIVNSIDELKVLIKKQMH